MPHTVEVSRRRFASPTTYVSPRLNAIARRKICGQRAIRMKHSQDCERLRVASSVSAATRAALFRFGSCWGFQVRDDALYLIRIAGFRRRLEDAAHNISSMIAASWNRGDRFLCVECHEHRGAESEHQVQGGKCDACGDTAAWLWEWRREDITGVANDFVELAEWKKQNERLSG
jgi:hypothetical protein